jgi:hypothetical protein
MFSLFRRLYATGLVEKISGSDPQRWEANDSTITR